MLISNPVKLGGLTCQSNQKENTNQNNAKRIPLPELPVLNQDKFISFKGLNKLPLDIMNNNFDHRIIRSSSGLLSSVCQEIAPKDILPVKISKVKTNFVAKVIANKCRESANVLMDENLYNPLKGVLNGMDSILSTLRTLGKLDDNKNNTINTAIDLYNEFQAKPIKFPKNKLLHVPNEQIDILNFISQSKEKFDPEVFKRLTKLDDNHFAIIFKEDELYNSGLLNEDKNLFMEGYEKIARSIGKSTFRYNKIFNYSA
jgi:hypothetical protein